VWVRGPMRVKWHVSSDPVFDCPRPLGQQAAPTLVPNLSNVALSFTDPNLSARRRHFSAYHLYRLESSLICHVSGARAAQHIGRVELPTLEAFDNDPVHLPFIGAH
jgi:hypothetical protein